MREVDGVVAIAPGVERIAVAGNAADYSFRFGTLRARERGKVQAGGGGLVENHLGQASGAGDDRDSPAARPALALADLQHLGHLVEVGDLDRAMGAQNFREDARVSV